MGLNKLINSALFCKERKLSEATTKATLWTENKKVDFNQIKLAVFMVYNEMVNLEKLFKHLNEIEHYRPQSYLEIMRLLNENQLHQYAVFKNELVRA